MKLLQYFFTIIFLTITCLSTSFAQWTNSNGKFYGRVYSFSVSDTNLFAAEDGGILRSTDGGANWEMMYMDGYFDALAVKGSNQFVGSYEGIFLSTDNGKSWTSVNNGLTTNIVLSLVVSGINLFAGTGGGGVFLSTNNGASWTAVNSGLTDFTVWSLFISGTNLFAGTQNGIFLTTNNGSSWTPVNNGLTNKVVDSFIECENHLFAATWGGGIFVSTNNGAEWKEVNAGLQNHYIISFAVSGTNIFAGSEVGVFQSTDLGSNWKAASTGLVRAIIYSLTIYGDNLLAGTAYNGVWRRPLSEMITSVEKHSSNIPVQFSLEQNYPNPFNPNTVISYAIPISGNVVLKVYNALGQEVATLINGYKTAQQYKVEFNASNLSSGMYLCKITYNNRSLTKKMVLIK